MGTRARHAAIAAATAAALLVGVRVFRSRPLDWPGAKRLVRERFPGARQLSTTELAAWLDDRTRPAPVLVDVRTEAEFAVSRIAGARRVDPDASAAAVLATGVERRTPLVLYCSVGYRSSALAERLQAAGFESVFSLEGSIFEWANEGRPLSGQDAVHPFDAKWGELLDERLRADVPPVR